MVSLVLNKTNGTLFKHTRVLRKANKLRLCWVQDLLRSQLMLIATGLSCETVLLSVRQHKFSSLATENILTNKVDFAVIFKY